MEPHSERDFLHPQITALLELLDQGHQVVQVIGPWGSGKSSLLRVAEAELVKRVRPVFSLSCRRVLDTDELGLAIVDAVRDSPFGELLPDALVVQSSAGGPSLLETIAVLRELGRRIPAPVLMLDELSETAYPARMTSGIEQLALELNDWTFVVASRPAPDTELTRIRRLERLVLPRPVLSEAVERLRALSEGLPSLLANQLAELTGDDLALLQTVARDDRSTVAAAPSITDMLRYVLDVALRSAPDPELFGALVDELALFGGRCGTLTLSVRLGISSDEVRDLVLGPKSVIVVYSSDDDTVALFHPVFRDFVLSERIRFTPVQLADLRLGSEEAEKDDLLDETFVESHRVRIILEQRQSLIVGDRGSGKSALHRKLSGAEGQRMRICPVANTGDLLHRIVAPDSWLDAQALRAAWLVVVASVVAGRIPPTAPRQLRGKAADLRAALGFPTERAGVLRRVLRPLRGTTLSFAVGPVTLQATLPADGTGRQGKTVLDVDSFLTEADDFLGKAGQRVVVMIDRIDETFKYDRAKQEPVVQALLQAEGHVTQTSNIGMVIFLRTDLFELYDIQEKNKLVSRTLTIEWTEEEWLQVLVRRVLANEQFHWLAERVGVGEGDAAIRTALSVLFPAEIENQPINRWLVDSLRNGNGDISPRLAVLLLHLARKHADKSEAVVSALPVFSGTTLSTAMTRLSELSFSEVVNDFKVASSFVLNCRAAKKESFTLAAVENLFDEADGTMSEQVRLLERLGFLERIVVETDAGAESMFRIPKLYTRCWDHA